MDKELQNIFYPPNAPPGLGAEVNSTRTASEPPSTLRKKLVISACVCGTAAMAGMLIPFVSPGFRRIALPYIPATDQQVNLVTSVLARRKGRKMVDLGSGDGRLVIAAAQQGLQATGVEMNWWLVLWSRWKSYTSGVTKNTNFIRSDLYKCDLGVYDVIVLFGVGGMMDTIKKKLVAEMHPDTMFIACRFPLPSAVPSEQLGAGIDRVWVYTKSDITGNRLED